MTKKLTDELKMTMVNEFVHGYTDEHGVRKYPTIDGLVRRHDVSRATLYRHSQSENWQQKKNQYQTELQETVSQERMQRAVEEARKLDDSCIQLSMAMLTAVGRRVQKVLQSQAADLDAEINAPQFHQLTDVAVKAQRMGKLALGEAQEISKVSANVSNPESFRAVMDQLDELAAARSQEDGGPVH
tara:strand:- start:1231 stop:1788 length:558 start_codon:yes stop_codon:yes gene_type:complete